MHSLIISLGITVSTLALPLISSGSSNSSSRYLVYDFSMEFAGVAFERSEDSILRIEEGFRDRGLPEEVIERNLDALPRHDLDLQKGQVDNGTLSVFLIPGQGVTLLTSLESISIEGSVPKEFEPRSSSESVYADAYGYFPVYSRDSSEPLMGDIYFKEGINISTKDDPPNSWLPRSISHPFAQWLVGFKELRDLTKGLGISETEGAVSVYRERDTFLVVRRSELGQINQVLETQDSHDSKPDVILNIPEWRTLGDSEVPLRFSISFYDSQGVVAHKRSFSLKEAYVGAEANSRMPDSVVPSGVYVTDHRLDEPVSYTLQGHIPTLSELAGRDDVFPARVLDEGTMEEQRIRSSVVWTYVAVGAGVLFITIVAVSIVRARKA